MKYKSLKESNITSEEERKLLDYLIYLRMPEVPRRSPRVVVSDPSDVESTPSDLGAKEEYKVYHNHWLGMTSTHEMRSLHEVEKAKVPRSSLLNSYATFFPPGFERGVLHASKPTKSVDGTYEATFIPAHDLKNDILHDIDPPSYSTLPPKLEESSEESLAEIDLNASSSEEKTTPKI